MQKISFTVDGLRLSAALFFPAQPKEKNPAILFVQGWTGEKERSYQYADALSKLGYICFLFDNKGHGESEGDIKSYSIKDFLKGLLDAYDYLLGIDGVDKENISAVGSSFGGYLIALLSERRKVNNLVLRAPADYPDKEFEEPKYKNSGSGNPDIIAWRKQEKNPTDTLALCAVNKFGGNVLMVESGNDDIVPHESTANYINAMKDKKKLTHIIVKDAPHSIREGKFRDEITKILIDWFRTKL